MAIRENLIESAVSFLRDPSVASAPIEKRIAFLQSKNLTQEEVDVALARAGGDDVAGVAQSTAVNPSGYAYRTTGPPAQYGGAYPGYWQQPPPPELPKRDWRDWFIMATVLGGVSYGLYFTAKRYIVPLIAPPTPAQLESDKAHVDQSFEKAFSLLEQLSTDTATLKSAEESRTQKLDTALADLESTIAALKESERRRDDDARRTADEVRGLRDLIPKALESNKESQEQRLRELGTELKSLKTLIGNRVSGPRPGESAVNAGALRAQAGLYTPPASAPQAPSVTQASSPQPPLNGPNGTAASSVPQSTVPAAPEAQNATNAVPSTNGVSTDATKPTPSYSRFSSGKAAAIPAWQMAAQKKEQEEKKTDTSASGTVTETAVGA